MKKTYRLPALLLSALFALGSVPHLSYADGVRAPYPAALSAQNALDASAAGDPAASEIGAEDFFREYCGIDLSDAERDFLTHTGTVFRYSSVIPSDRIVCTHLESGLKVEALEYAYASASLITVRWIPTEVSVEGNSVKLDASSRTAVFEGLEGGKTYEIEVKYKTEITVPSENLMKAVNAAYLVGADADGRRSAYEADLAEYERKSQEYSALYAAYVEAGNRYERYLSEKEEYDRRKEAYDEYLVKKSAYGEQLDAYNAYLEAKAAYDAAYAAYESETEAYREAYKNYLINAAEISACQRTLTTMETVFIVDEQGHCMYNTLMGSTVDTVLKNQGTLERQAGVNPKDVQGAGDATEALRSVLPAYRKLKTTAAKFSYYAEHYSEIRDNFIKLFKHLNSLIANSVVREVLAKEGKLDRYYQFTAHLYVLSSCFDDTKVYDPAWTIRGKTLQSQLSPLTLIDDDNVSDPAGLVCPEGALDEPEAPVAPEEPDVVTEPVKTWDADLTEPVLPEAVEKPADPGTLQQYAGTKPSSPLFTADETALSEQVRAGTLRERTVDAVKIGFETTVRKSAAYEGAVVVRFFDADRTTLLYSTTILKGNAVSYHGATPFKAADEKYAYTFAGFFDGSGNKASLGSADADADYYARYEAKAIEYVVTFFVGEKQTLRTYGYGDLPEAPDYPESYTDGEGVRYVFSGFEPAITVVTGNASYTAKYSAVLPDRYTVVFNCRGVKTTVVTDAGATPVPPQTESGFDDELYRYVFTGWSPEISPADRNAEYTAQYERTPLVPDLEAEGCARVVAGADGRTVLLDGSDHVFDVRSVFADAAKDGTALGFSTGVYTLSFGAQAAAACAEASTICFYGSANGLYIRLEDRDGGDLLADGAFDVLLGGVAALSEDCELAYAGETEERVNFTLIDGRMLFDAPAGGAYVLYRPHTVTVTGGRAQASVGRALPGERVTVSVPEGKDGVTVGSLILTIDGQSGTRTVLGDSFVMPDANVTVEPVFTAEKVLYTVRFLEADGSTLEERTYEYGEPVVLPSKTPEKVSSDARYVYAFTGWEPTVIANVVEDATYAPVFKQVNDADYKSPYDSDNFVTKVLLLQVLPVFVLIVLLICGPIVYRAYVKKRRNGEK